MKSPTEWFGSKPANSYEAPSFAESAGNVGKGFVGQVKSMGTAISSGMGKAKNAIIAPFTSSDDPDSATSLVNLPNDLGPEVWVANGQLFESQGNYAKALDEYNKALQRESNNEAALLSIARLYGRQDQDAQAVEYFQKAIAANPSNAASHNELALLYKESGRATEAQTAIQKAIAIDPTNPLYRNNLAGVLVATGRGEEAVKQLEQVFPPAVANYNVAYLHFTNKNTAGAQQHLQIALQQDPNLKQARQLLDRIGGSGTAQTAIAAYETANNIYRTAQAAGTPSQAGSAIYQQAGSQTNAAVGYPGMQPTGNAAPNYSTPGIAPQNQFAPTSGSAGQGYAAPNYNTPTTSASSYPSAPNYGQGTAPQTQAPGTFPGQSGSPTTPPLPNLPSTGYPSNNYPTNNYPTGGSQASASPTARSPMSTVSYGLPSTPSAQSPQATTLPLLPPPDANRYNTPQ